MREIDYQHLTIATSDVPAQTVRHPVVVVGAGPVGLSLALDLGQRGQKVLLLDDDNALSTGSRAICFAKRTLDIWDRLGVGQRMVDKGISWNRGKVFYRNEEVWSFDLLPAPDHRRPAFINLQQYYCEGFLYEAAQAHPNIELRFLHKVTHAEDLDDGTVELQVHTPEDSYRLYADWVVACDGSRSTLRQIRGHESKGQTFKDRFLIADVRMAASFPCERWFWFDPPFHPQQSVLLHSQPDNVWRIDFQLGWDADPKEEVKADKVRTRVQALLGNDIEFEIEWASVYTFACERMEKFRDKAVFFAGDAAHRVSPFGARGANSGIQDADNLAWKLDKVLRGQASDALLDTYHDERSLAADENLRHSTRSTDFITPKSEISLLFRNLVLELAKEHSFARALVNSGRLSNPSTYAESPLNTPDSDVFKGELQLGGCAVDAPLLHAQQDTWLLSTLGNDFSLLIYEPSHPTHYHAALVNSINCPLQVVIISSDDSNPDVYGDYKGHFKDRFDATADSCYLLRPDHHLCARWRTFDAKKVADALDRACAYLH
ncbi:FAD-dependent oxidoreductase [Paenalcaligenes niemegkensis]|uniref:FAD-dependent oxidoreductase n=1 Tax=Paenalcaligenes niemegkensis TaxID=2895469 RepID=UPI001EE9A0C6|nr:FAD-dependent oxidoreductase [Paenalcaligenes niemegkensis]MCQ9617238.1 FAD-dependent oxidoreductase [Paenalcaligenes niemegkensis]